MLISFVDSRHPQLARAIGILPTIIGKLFFATFYKPGACPIWRDLGATYEQFRVHRCNDQRGRIRIPVFAASKAQWVKRTPRKTPARLPKPSDRPDVFLHRPDCPPCLLIRGAN